MCYIQPCHVWMASTLMFAHNLCYVIHKKNILQTTSGIATSWLSCWNLFCGLKHAVSQLQPWCVTVILVMPSHWLWRNSHYFQVRTVVRMHECRSSRFATESSQDQQRIWRRVITVRWQWMKWVHSSTIMGTAGLPWNDASITHVCTTESVSSVSISMLS